MFRTIEDFSRAWTYERAKTLGVIAAIPNAKLATPTGDAHRNLGQLAWHLVESCVELPGHLGLKPQGPPLNEDGFIADPVASKTDKIHASYAMASASVAEKVAKHWRDADLLKEEPIYGETWKRGYALYILVTHQAHHRGQMTVLMRQAGLTVPEVYGPTKEQWAGYGKPVPVV